MAEDEAEKELAVARVLYEQINISSRHVQVTDMTERAAETFKHRADADVEVAKASVDVAEAQAKAAESIHGTPAREETKREISKTRWGVSAVASIIAVAAFKLEGNALAWVLGSGLTTLAAAWGLREALRSTGKTKMLAPKKD